MDKSSYKNEIYNFIEQFVDNVKYISKDVKQYNCIMCGRSKNNDPHMRIDYENGFYYCYRCNDGGILYNLIKEFKNNSNSSYVNNLLKPYFSFYEYDSSDKRIKTCQNYNSYNFTNGNLTLQKIDDITMSDLQKRFFNYRLPTLSDDDINKVISKFKINLNNSDDKFYYNSFYRKLAYSYKINEDLTYKKDKAHNNKIVNDRRDYYYLINNSSYKNLYISEGLFDLITIDIIDPLYNTKESNFLALCSKTYKMLYDILVSSGKFYYKNIFFIMDNDILKRKTVDELLKNLSNNKNYNKFKLYDNIYTITVPYKYIDLNDYYLNINNTPEILITKVK